MQPSDAAKSRDRQLYAVLHVAEEDLRQAAYFATYLLKRGWHFEPWERRWTVYMQQAAFTTALATAYSRPFTEARGRPKVPNRLLRQFTNEQRNLHKRVLKLRNLVYAHSDVGSRSVRPILIANYPTAIAVMPPMRFTREEVLELQSMISEAQRSIAARKQALAPLVVD